MSDEPGRRYSEAEMQAIMARAAKRQARSRAAEAERAGGFSLAELEQIAAAAGIDPDHVVAAVGEVGAPPERGATVLGARVVVERVRRLPGPVSDEMWAQMVGELRRAFGEDGVAGQLGRVREWSAVGRGARRDLTTKLSLEPDGDGTRVTLRQSIRDVTFAFHLAGGLTGVMAVLFGTLFVAGVDPEMIIPTLLLVGMAVLFLGGTQVGARIWARRQEEKFEGVLDRMELVARSSTGGADVQTAARTEAGLVGERAAATAPAPRIALDDADMPDASEEARRDAHRTRT